MSVSSKPPGLLAIDRAFIVYLGLTGIIALVTGGTTGLGVAALHALAIAGVVWLSRRPLPAGRLRLFARLVYPVALTPLLYKELATLNQFLTTGYFDDLVQSWELSLFGSQLSEAASGWLGWLGISELLHVGYATYYVLVPAALVGVAVTRGPQAVQRVAFAVALAFFVCYAIFVVFPVAGPRYLFPRIEGVPAQGTVFQLVHALLETASSKGTAFPSSHVAASTAAVLAAGREDRRWLWLLGPAALLLALGTVYGRFHYAVDALAGALIALGALALTRRREADSQATPAVGRVSNV